MVLYTSNSKRNKVGINFFLEHIIKSLMSFILQTLMSSIYLLLLLNFFASLKLSGDLELTNLSITCRERKTNYFKITVINLVVYFNDKSTLIYIMPLVVTCLVCFHTPCFVLFFILLGGVNLAYLCKRS